MMLPKGVAHCETSNASPNQMDVYVVSSMLDKIPDSWLCCVGPSLCTTMMWWYTAGSDICNWKSYNKYIHCDAASAAVYLIANKCAKNKKVGGFVRFGSEVDVNAYHTWRDASVSVCVRVLWCKGFMGCIVFQCLLGFMAMGCLILCGWRDIRQRRVMFQTLGHRCGKYKSSSG
ncbi:hypothetical protein BDD12DRAFT_823366 [Trichophaea hybrida]|nr:hypothetical protein BDD12DRAFT_823366 [Trichophaea hybrida]